MRGRLILWAAALAMPASGGAQTPISRGVSGPDSATLATLDSALAGHPSIRVRLRTNQPDLVLLAPHLDGHLLRFERYAPGAWTRDTTTGPHVIPLAEVSRIQVRASAWDKGAVIGFLAGAGAIETVNAAGKYGIDKGETVFIGAFFGIIGAVAGGVVGAPFHKWHTIYESP